MRIGGRGARRKESRDLLECSTMYLFFVNRRPQSRQPKSLTLSSRACERERSPHSPITTIRCSPFTPASRNVAVAPAGTVQYYRSRRVEYGSVEYGQNDALELRW